jgi:hypothetical protein
LLARVRRSYLRQSDAAGWLRLDAARAADAIAADVYDAVQRKLGEGNR